MNDDAPETEDEEDAATGTAFFLYPGRPGVSVDEARRVFALEFADAAGVAVEKILADAAIIEAYLRDGSVPAPAAASSASRLRPVK